jgi:hypothetical protein
MGFFQIFALELVSNIPAWLGFMIAVKLFYESKSRWWQSALILFAFCLVSGSFILLFEPVKLGGSEIGPLYPEQILAMAAIFTVAGLPFLWYIATTSRWVSWRSDLILAAGLGVVLTIGEALVLHIFDPRVLIMHALSMTIAAGVTVPVMRYLRCQAWRVTLAGAMVVVIVASGLIVAVEYMPGSTQANSTEHATAAHGR